MKIMKNKSHHYLIGCGNRLETHLNDDKDDKLLSAEGTAGEHGTCAPALWKAISELCRYTLKLGGTPEELVRRMKGHTCDKPGGLCEKKHSSCVDLFARIIEDHEKGKKNESKGL